MLPEAAEKIGPALQTARTETSRVFSGMPGHRTLRKDLKNAGIVKVDEAGSQVDFHAFALLLLHLIGQVPADTNRVQVAKTPRYPHDL